MKPLHHLIDYPANFPQSQRRNHFMNGHQLFISMHLEIKDVNQRSQTPIITGRFHDLMCYRSVKFSMLSCSDEFGVVLYCDIEIPSFFSLQISVIKY